jgi:hypothetical protein
MRVNFARKSTGDTLILQIHARKIAKHGSDIRGL